LIDNETEILLGTQPLPPPPSGFPPVLTLLGFLSLEKFHREKSMWNDICTEIKMPTANRMNLLQIPIIWLPVLHGVADPDPLVRGTDLDPSIIKKK
jgi:hypothetical protein